MPTSLSMSVTYVSSFWVSSYAAHKFVLFALGFTSLPTNAWTFVEHKNTGKVVYNLLVKIILSLDRCCALFLSPFSSVLKYQLAFPLPW